MTAREAILQRLYQGREQQGGLDVPVSNFAVLERPHWNHADKRQRFEQAMRSVHTEIHSVSRDNWCTVLQQLATEKGLHNLWVSPDTCHGKELTQHWQLTQTPLLQHCPPLAEWKDELFNQVNAALTGCRGAIAETGSLILWPTIAEPRVISLVPPVHFVLLDGNQLYSTLHQAMHQQGWADTGMPTNALLISGPSKTADIEQTLAYGVHGPKELIVLVLE